MTNYPNNNEKIISTYIYDTVIVYYVSLNYIATYI